MARTRNHPQRVRYAAGPLIAHMSTPVLDQAPPTTRQMAETLDVSRRNLIRWKFKGLPEIAADRAAVSLGMHPSELWPEWWANCPTVAA